MVSSIAGKGHTPVRFWYLSRTYNYRGLGVRSYQARGHCFVVRVRAALRERRTNMNITHDDVTFIWTPRVQILEIRKRASSISTKYGRETIEGV